ncbi:MAG: helix-turn-helix domain-containing protein [Clostridia bacterium]|nr:helix-turn-helix domain-containing protein [Clostridia bacterium]MBR7083468.1 helix-turn-helix domain-containing protein [Clostridia bacterium]
MTELGRLLKIIRVNSGDTAKEMAAKLYMSPSYLSAIESGKRNIPANLIGSIAEVYDLSPEDKEKLRNAVLGEDKPLKMNLANFCDRKKRLILAISQDDFPKETFNKICALAFGKIEDVESIQ